MEAAYACSAHSWLVYCSVRGPGFFDPAFSAIAPQMCIPFHIRIVSGRLLLTQMLCWMMPCMSLSSKLKLNVTMLVLIHSHEGFEQP